MVELKLVDGNQYYVSNEMQVSFTTKEWLNAKARYARQLAKKRSQQASG